MVRFNTSNSRPVRNYFSRREQWRLLLLIMALGVVIIAMRQLRRPETVSRVERVFSEAPVTSIPRDVQSSEKRPGAASAAELNPVPRVRPESLAVIKDNAYFRNAEKGAWFEIIAALQQTTVQDLERGSSGEVGYVQLVDQPSAYRGRLVTVRGTARQVTEQKPAENDLGLESYYRVVVQPSDGSIWPIFVYCLELPDGFPRGAEIAVEVSATGYFFKNLSYAWRDGLGIAPVILAKQLKPIDPMTSSAAPAALSHKPSKNDAWNADDTATLKAAKTTPNLHEVLSLAGWNAERFAGFLDDRSLSDDEQKQLVELLWRVRTFDAASIDEWAESDVSVRQLIEDPVANRGKMVQLVGRVVGAERHALSADEAARLELPDYYTCDIETENGRAVVVAASVPKAWQELKTLDEPVSVSALFVKRMPETDEGQPALLVAKRIAWHPTTPREGTVSLGESVLGSLGMDVGLLDGIRSHGAIRAEEREAFYQLLSAVGKIGANQLARFAQQNLDAILEQWMDEAASATDSQRRPLAQEVVRRAEEGRYSVAPLFNDAEGQVGELVVVDGSARRVVRVDVGLQTDGGGPSDVARRFGLDHYYEMEVFTDDSQNYPLIFCVRELPAGFPTGGELQVPVRVAGFFFKDWLYRTRHTGNSDTSDGEDRKARSQYAPLLIGRAPLMLEPQQQGDNLARLVGGGLFLVALGCIWAAAWWFARDDRKFAERTRSSFSLPPGESLNELKLEGDAEPMK